jgi:hypothetical protein
MSAETLACFEGGQFDHQSWPKRIPGAEYASAVYAVNRILYWTHTYKMKLARVILG